jgi:hypothetical protein
MGDLPQELLDEAARTLSVFATALGWPGVHVGGGTFVRINGRAGILTARHVWDDLDTARDEHPNVNLIIKDGAHSYSLPVQYFTPHVFLNERSKAFGPDIQFLELPQEAVSKIAATKSFAEISANAERWLPLAMADDGFGVELGFPAEHARRVAHGKSDVLLELRGGYVTKIQNHRRKYDCDYVETVAEQESVAGLPRSYAGVSGSGLWRVPMNKKAGEPIDKATMAGNYVLAGIVFYQEAFSRRKMMIRCHGPETIYKMLPALVPHKK